MNLISAESISLDSTLKFFSQNTQHAVKNKRNIKIRGELITKVEFFASVPKSSTQMRLPIQNSHDWAPLPTVCNFFVSIIYLSRVLCLCVCVCVCVCVRRDGGFGEGENKVGKIGEGEIAEGNEKRLFII